jgi:hypothetical protein
MNAGKVFSAVIGNHQSKDTASVFVQGQRGKPALRERRSDRSDNTNGNVVQNKSAGVKGRLLFSESCE